MGFVGLGLVKGVGVWGAIYLVETGLELGQDVCHDFIVEGAEGVDSRRSVRLWAGMRFENISNDLKCILSEKYGFLFLKSPIHVPV